ncbi:MAG: DUF1576 domain-containing protein [Defluviitaleaceae bacterium]|nr:DUF1576 domain-containing protein [Defluviitaleaceae bacterium]
MNFFREKFLEKPFRVHGFLFLAFIVAGIIYDSPRGVFEGLLRIFSGSDVLVSDYISIGGFGATLVNVGLVGLLAILALVIAKHEPGGLTMGTHGLAIGFAFFGKNPLNMLPIIVGGFLYAVVSKKPPSQCVLRAVLATCLAPAVTQVAYATNLPLPLSIGIGIVVGLLIGFLINPLAVHKEMAHMGYNLYNVGFAAGIIGMGIFAVYRLVGAYFYTSDVWSYGYDLHLMIFVLIVSAYFIFCGSFAKGKSITLRFFYEPHSTDNDYFNEYREKIYIHMGVMGLACSLFMLVTGGSYNGPVVGAILSVIGFGAFGKALLSAAPVVAGAMIAAFIAHFVTGIPANDSNFLVAAIFSTCLSPLSRKFGMMWGLIAGFLHLALAVNIGGFHGGLNLYNNGFAGGLAAMILLPIILFVQRERARRKIPRRP